MEWNVCLRIPLICDAGASAQGASLRNDSSRPAMAQSVLVRQTVGTASRLSFGPAIDRGQDYKEKHKLDSKRI